MKVNRSFRTDSKRLVAFICLTILLLILQTAIFSNLFAGQYVPQLMAIVIMFLAFYWRTTGGLIFCWLLGLLLDFQIAVLLGPSMIASIMIFFIFSTIANNLYINSQFVLVLSGAVGAFLLIFIQQIIQNIFIDVGLSNLLALMKDALATALIAPLIFPLLSRWFLTSSKI